jgi:hypothetical protein
VRHRAAGDFKFLAGANGNRVEICWCDLAEMS